MIRFLRKYQKFFFVFITVVIVTSFSFFGTYSTIQNSFKRKDQKIGKKLDGTSLQRAEIESLSLFLSMESSDGRDPRMQNFLNDGVLSEDFFKTGASSLFAKLYFPQIQEDLQKNLEKIKKHSFYVHPSAPFISSASVWKQLLPEAYEHICLFQKKEKVSLEDFETLSQLYLAQKTLSPALVQKVLYYQQQQNQVQPDPNFFHEDFSLFGFHTIQDWFGQNFLDSVSQFILNAAALAEQKGYQISDEQVLADLIQKVRLQRAKEQKKIQESDVEILQRQMARFGLDEKMMVDLWKKVLLFRKIFRQEVERKVFVDPSAYQDFASYALENAQIDLYELPSYLQFKTFEDLMKFQLYLKKAFPSSHSLESLPIEAFSSEVLMKTCPSLLQQRYELRVAKTSLEELGLRVGEKELWLWQTDEKNWKQISIGSLAGKLAKTKEERFCALEKLLPEERQKIDKISREKIVTEHPEWIEASLQQNDTKALELLFHCDGRNLPFEGCSLEQVKQLKSLLDKVPLTGEKKEFFDFTGNQKTFYRIEVISREANPKLLLFSEALADGTLDFLLNTYLEKGEGKETPPIGKREDLGKVLFSDILKTLDGAMLRAQKKTLAGGSLDEYAKYRLFFYVQAIKASLQQKQDLSCVCGKEEKRSLENQWKLNVRDLAIVRATAKDWMKKEIFEKNSSSWSFVHLDPEGLQFFHLKSKGFDTQERAKDLQDQREILIREAQLTWVGELLEHLKKGDQIVLPVPKTQIE